jgi:porphobilinogen deaminase
LFSCVSDGTRIMTGDMTSDASLRSAEKLGQDLAADMIRRGADKILDSVLQKPQTPISPP